MIKKARQYQPIFSLNLFSSHKGKLLAEIYESIRWGRRFWLVTLNPEFVIASKNDSSFLATLQKANLIVPDGIGLIWAVQVKKEKKFFKRFLVGLKIGLRILKGQLANQVISGTDLMTDLCQMAADNHWTVYLLGGEKEVAKKALAVLKQRFPKLVGWAESGPNFSYPLLGSQYQKPDVSNQILDNDIKKWVEKINQKKPTLLFVALGMKKQEQFISQNWPQLKVGFAMGVGGAFDYLAGKVKRPSPKWRERGLEWLSRLINQPWRVNRQLALLKFIWLVIKGH